MKTVLREWQRLAINEYLSSLEQQKKAALWEATPGAGKTVAALYVCIHQLKKRGANKILVVVPTSHLKLQWSRAAHQLGIELDTTYGIKRSSLPKGFHGAVVTYQQIGNRPDFFIGLAQNSAVVLDEVHHAADGLRWGDALRQAVGSAAYILCLSGTAFRSDNNTIPFVTYDKEGLSKPQYVYSYAHAVNESVCRPTAFFTYGGEVTWSDGDKKEYTASFNDPLEPQLSARRLRAALDAKSGWITPLLKDAHEMLLSTRKTQPNAAALLVASDQDHARDLAELLAAHTKVHPVVVLSDDASASRKIKSFSDGSSPWLVACNMVSEGVDIPRLRIGVYATTVKTRMYFRQFLGRIVRRTPTPEGVQIAYCYLPADPRFRLLAEEIETETQHCISKPKESTFGDEQADRKEKSDDERGAQTWQALHGSNSGLDSIIVGGAQLSFWGQSESGLAVNQESLDQVITQEINQRLTLSEELSQLGTHIKQLVAIYHRKTKKPHSYIHSELNRAQGVRSQLQCSKEQLKHRIFLLSTWNKKAANA